MNTREREQNRCIIFTIIITSWSSGSWTGQTHDDAQTKAGWIICAALRWYQAHVLETRQDWSVTPDSHHRRLNSATSLKRFPPSPQAARVSSSRRTWSLWRGHTIFVISWCFSGWIKLYVSFRWRCREAVRVNPGRGPICGEVWASKTLWSRLEKDIFGLGNSHGTQLWSSSEKSRWFRFFVNENKPCYKYNFMVAVKSTFMRQILYFLPDSKTNKHRFDPLQSVLSTFMWISV